MKRCSVLLFILFVTFNPLFSQTNSSVRTTSVQNHGWYMYFGNHRLTDKWSLHTEYQWRRADVIINWQQSLARIGFDYRITDNFSATAGYGFIITYPYGKQPVNTTFNEHRIWQQVVFTHAVGTFQINHRYRLEQRWSEQMVLQNSGEYRKEGYNYNNRFRYRFMINYPIKFKKENSKFFLSVYDEVFINFGKNVRYNIFDQNRFYFALGYKFSESGNVQLGYLNQVIIKSNGQNTELNHTLQASITYNLDFRRKQ